MKEGRESNVYEDDYREEMSDADEIDIEEEGFMQGYEEEKNPAECAYCGKILKKEIVEREIDGEIYMFCSDIHADKFERQKDHI